MEADFRAVGTERLDGYDFWRLCDVLSITQAALLLLGENPADLEHSVDSRPANQPPNYIAARTAISNALVAELIEGKVSYDQQYGEYVEFQTSTVVVDSLREWLKSKGITTGFYFHGEPSIPDFADPANGRYAPKLAAAVAAWTALDDTSDLGGVSPKEAVKKWLREHAANLGLSNKDGTPNETGIEEIAKVANWQPSGGAPKTPSK